MWEFELSATLSKVFKLSWVCWYLISNIKEQKCPSREKYLGKVSNSDLNLIYSNYEQQIRMGARLSITELIRKDTLLIHIFTFLNKCFIILWWLILLIILTWPKVSKYVVKYYSGCVYELVSTETLFNKNTYWKVLFIERERKGQRENSSILSFAPQKVTMAGASKQKSLPGLPFGCKSPRLQAVLHSFPRLPAGKGLEAEQSGLQPMTISDADTTGRGLAFYATAVPEF